MVFAGVVRSALLSGCEALNLKRPEINKLEGEQVRYLRKLMGGKAHWKTAEGRDCALTNEQVRFRTKFATIDSTLRSRRIAWLQQMVREPYLHSQLWTALLGEFEWSQKQLDSNMRPVAHCNPWLRTFWEDILILKEKCEWTHWREEVEQNGFLVILRPIFAAMKPKIVLSYHWKFERKSEQKEQVCNFEYENGTHCDFWCPNVHSYNSHMWQTHKIRPKVYNVILSNKCPYCERILADYQSLKNHLRVAQKKGVCPNPKKAHHYKAYCGDLALYTEDNDFTCPVCDNEAENLEQHQAHCRIFHPLSTEDLD